MNILTDLSSDNVDELMVEYINLLKTHNMNSGELVNTEDKIKNRIESERIARLMMLIDFDRTIYRKYQSR